MFKDSIASYRLAVGFTLDEPNIPRNNKSDRSFVLVSFDRTTQETYHDPAVFVNTFFIFGESRKHTVVCQSYCLEPCRAGGETPNKAI